MQNNAVSSSVEHSSLFIRKLSEREVSHDQRFIDDHKEERGDQLLPSHHPRRR